MHSWNDQNYHRTYNGWTLVGLWTCLNKAGNLVLPNLSTLLLRIIRFLMKVASFDSNYRLPSLPGLLSNSQIAFITNGEYVDIGKSSFLFLVTTRVIWKREKGFGSLAITALPDNTFARGSCIGIRQLGVDIRDHHRRELVWSSGVNGRTVAFLETSKSQRGPVWLGHLYDNRTQRVSVAMPG